MASANRGSSGCESWREYSVVDLEVIETVDGANRGRKDERIENVVTWLAAILKERRVELDAVDK